jgi:hypothetical protein
MLFQLGRESIDRAADSFREKEREREREKEGAGFTIVVTSTGETKPDCIKCAIIYLISIQSSSALRSLARYIVHLAYRKNSAIAARRAV